MAKKKAEDRVADAKAKLQEFGKTKFEATTQKWKHRDLDVLRTDLLVEPGKPLFDAYVKDRNGFRKLGIFILKEPGKDQWRAFIKIAVTK